MIGQRQHYEHSALCDQTLEPASGGRMVAAGGGSRQTPDLGPLKSRSQHRLRVASIIALLALPGCCWLSKRTCFPPCETTKTVVEVERPCELPPQLVLEAVQRTTCPDDKMICFSALEAGKLAANLNALKTWIREARARCGPTSQPTSQPIP